MYVSTLDVVNACLATMGETPLNTLEEDHSYKAAALTFLNQSNMTEQKRGFWFNKETITLSPDATSKYIYLPNDAISVKPLDKVTPPFGQRGNRLYNAADNSYVWGSDVQLQIVRLVSFDNLPFHAADAVSSATVLRFQRAFDGDQARYQQCSSDYQRARVELNAEDMRQSKYNLLDNASNSNKMQLIRPGIPTIPSR